MASNGKPKRNSNEDLDEVDGDLTCLTFNITKQSHPAKNKPTFDRLNSTGENETRDNQLESKTKSGIRLRGSPVIHAGCREKTSIQSHALHHKDWWQSLKITEQEKILGHIEDSLHTYKSDISCKVCLEKRVSRVFQPCGHLTCCADCAKMLKECPICRKVIKSLVIVVLPKPKTGKSVDIEHIAKRHRLMDVLK